MHFQQVVGHLLPWATLKSTADIDAEIREELEFHLAMHTEENMQAGMSEEEARLDAERRFGDLEAKRRACQKIDLGPRLLVQRLQFGMLVLLAAIAIYQAMALTQMRSQSKDQIETLTRTIQQLQEAGQVQPTVDRTMPYLHWTPNVSGSVAKQTMQDIELPDDWDVHGDTLATPWCNWHELTNDTGEL